MGKQWRICSKYLFFRKCESYKISRWLIFRFVFRRRPMALLEHVYRTYLWNTPRFQEVMCRGKKKDIFLSFQGWILGESIMEYVHEWIYRIQYFFLYFCMFKNIFYPLYFSCYIKIIIERVNYYPVFRHKLYIGLILTILKKLHFLINVNAIKHNFCLYLILRLFR